MRYLEKLLKGVEVEWKPLEDVCDFKNGFAFKSSLFKENGLPIIRITNVDGKNINITDVKYFNPVDYTENTKSYEVRNGDILIAMSGATTGKIGFYTHKNSAYLNQRVGKFLPKEEILNNRYLYHYLLSKVEEIYVISGGGAQPNLSSNALMAKIKIPIPCPENSKKSLEIQQKIVAILDSFTGLIAELTAELTARKQQYSYYREQLLNFDENEVEWKTLGEVGEIKRGVAFTKKQAVFGEFPVVANASEPISFHNEFNRNGEFIVVARSGANAGLISYWNKELFLTDAFSIHPNDSVLNTKFAFYFLKKHQREIHLMKQGSGVPHVRASDFEIYNIPVPSLEEQERIVSILDKFDTLTNSISEGLPKEIALRQKQYEYYRDLLLTFPKDN